MMVYFAIASQKQLTLNNKGQIHSYIDFFSNKYYILLFSYDFPNNIFFTYFK